MLRLTCRTLVTSSLLLLLCTSCWAQLRLGVSDRVKTLNEQLKRQVSLAPVEVQRAISEVPTVNPAEIHVVPAPEAPAKTVALVSDSQKQLLLNAVKKFTGDSKKQENRYSSLALAFLIGGAAFALLGSIFSFLKWNTTAGIIGLVVLAVVGFPNIFPMTGLADFYGVLSTQAIALETDCELKSPFTKDDYDAAEKQLKSLILYEAANRPKLGNTKPSTDDLVRQLQTYKTAAVVGSGGL